MKIAIITNIPSPYRIPLWMKLSEEADITVLYTSINDGFNREWEISFGEGYRYVVFADPKKNECSEYKINTKLYRHLLQSNYDIIIIGGYGNANNIISCLIGKFLGRKVVMLWDGGFESKETFLKRKIKAFFYKHLTDAFCVSGSNARNVLSRYVQSNEKFFNVHFTCDVDYYLDRYKELAPGKKELKQKLGYDRYSQVVLFVGRLHEQKGVFDLLKAFERIQSNDTCLVIVGTGPLEMEMKKLIEQKNICNVFFTGFVSIEKMPDYFTIADLLVLPSYYDPWGLVVNEAMASGLPVISTTMAGASYDLIHAGRNGFIIQPGDVDELTKGLKAILFDDATRQSMGEESSRIISKWTFRESVKGFKDCFQYFLKNEQQ